MFADHLVRGFVRLGQSLLQGEEIVDRFPVIGMVGKDRPITGRAVDIAFDRRHPASGALVRGPGELEVAVVGDIRVRTSRGTVYQSHLEGVSVRIGALVHRMICP